MKKQSNILAKILALILVVSMLASTVAPAFAENVDGSKKYPGGKLVDGSTGWNSAGGDQYLLEGDFDVTVAFENTPFIRNNDNWSNFVFEILEEEPRRGITLRADSYGWTFPNDDKNPDDPNNYTGAHYSATSTWGGDWDAFVAMCKVNPIVTLNLKKTNDTTITATINWYPEGSYPDLKNATLSARETYTITYDDGVPASLRAQVGADGGKVNILECRYNTVELEIADKASVAWGRPANPDITLSGDFSVVYTFHNATKGTDNWNNFVVEVDGGTSAHLYVRADAYGWDENKGAPPNTPNIFGDWTNSMDWSIGVNEAWAQFRADMANADVTVTIDRIDSEIRFIFDMVAVDSKRTYHMEGTPKLDTALQNELSISLFGDLAELTNIHATVYNPIEGISDDTGKIIYGAETKRVTVHDPSIVKDETTGYYYIFGSHKAWARSKDLITWQTFSNNVDRNFATIFADDAKWSERGGPQEGAPYNVSGNLWAPDVIWNETMQKWCMYMSVNGEKWYSSIVLLTADNIEGPYTRVGPVVYSGFRTDAEAAMTDFFTVTGEDTLPARYTQNRNNLLTYGMNAIDPCVTYDDETGKLWMTYGSWFGGIYMLELDPATGLRSSRTYELKTNESDPYLGIKIAGGNNVSGEASYLEKIGDYWFLFMTYGGLTAKGGYNMRVFRSEDITGPYKDLSGDTAIHTGTDAPNNINGTVGNRLMSYYQWTHFTKGQVAQGHNSAFVDDDGRAYVIYHTRFNDGTEGHQVRVHQLFLNEDGWLVTAPFEYAGEKLKEKVISEEDVLGTYEVLFHKGTNYAGLECVTGQAVTFKEKGVLSGSVEGTWTFSGEGSPYVTLKIGSTTYKGVFLYQKIEEKQDTEALCFTVLGSDEISVWGYKFPYSDEDFIDMAAEDLRQKLPIGTFGQNLTLPDKGLYEVEITKWESGNTAVIANDGTVTLPAQDTTVTLTATMEFGEATKEVKFPVKVFAKKSGTEPYLLWEYFTNEQKDLSTVKDGEIRYRNPFNGNNVLGIAIHDGVAIEFDAKPNGAMPYLESYLFSFRDNALAGLWFTGGSYLGFNIGDDWFDANVFDGYGGDDGKSWVAGTDFLKNSEKQTVKVKIEILPDGFKVYFNGVLAYTQDTYGAGKAVPGNNSGAGNFNYSLILPFLRSTATYLNFGSGVFWNDAGHNGFDGTISNVKLYVVPVEEVDTTGYVYYEDYNTAGDTGWTSQNAQGSLSLKYDSDPNHRTYVDYAEETSASGNRGAYTNFPAEANLSGEYIVEADIKMTSGTNSSLSQFAITGTDADYGNNYNNGIGSGYILKLSTNQTYSTTYYVNDGQESVTIPSNTWVHIKAIVKGTDVTVEITNGNNTQTVTTEVNGTGILKGLYLLRGRGRGTAAVDNIAVRRADFSALIAALAQFGTLTETDYTPASWATLAAAAAKGQDLLESEEATQAKVDEAAQAITAAIKGLAKRADTTALAEAIKAAKAYEGKGDNYTRASYKAVTDAVAAGEPLLENLNALQSDVDAKTKAIEDAIKGLVEINLLRATVNSAPTDSTKYTATSWEALAKAVAAGKALYEDGTEEAVEQAITDILDAIDALVDVSALNTILAEAEEKAADANSYTEASRDQLTAYIDEGEYKNLLVEATEDEIVEAVADIRDAIDALVDITALRDILAEAEEKAEDEISYSRGSRDALKAAIYTNVDEKSGKYDDYFVEATQAQVDAAVAAIRDAIKGLIRVYELTITYGGKTAAWSPERWAYVIDLDEGSTAPFYDDLDQIDVQVVIRDESGNVSDIEFTGTTRVDEGDEYGYYVIYVNPGNGWAYYDLIILVAGQMPVDPNIVTITGVTVDGIPATEDAEGNWTVELPSFSSTIPVPDGIGDEADRIVVTVSDPDIPPSYVNIVFADPDNPSGSYLITVAGTKVSATLTVTIAVADYTALNAALAKTPKQSEKEKYTDSSWANLQEALAKAGAEFKTQAEINAAAQALNAAIDALKARADTTELAAAIAEAEALTEADYTAESWAALEEALAKAEAVLADGDATQDEVDAAAEALEDAIAALEKAPDTYAISGTVTDSDGKPVDGATVTLKQGGKVIGSITTGADGEYSFTDVPAGLYSIVAENGDAARTILVRVTDDDVSNQDIKMPEGKISSVVEVKGEDKDIPAVAVDGLDAIAEAQATGSDDAVTVTLTVEAVTDPEGKADIESVVPDTVKKEDILYLDLSLFVTTGASGSTQGTPITDTLNNVLTIIIPYEFSGKKDVTVYRVHDGNVIELEPANGTSADGKFDADRDNGRITIYATKFSTYAIGYSTEPEQPQQPTTPAPTNYQITVSATSNGTVTVTPTTAISGAKVTVTATPDEGYKVDAVTVTRADGSAVEVTDNGDGTYSFTMPASQVTVGVTFTAIGEEPWVNPFTDVSEDDWFYSGVAYAAQKGLMSGIGGGKFDPSGTTTRGMLVTILYNLEGRPQVTASSTFTDVPAGKYYTNAVIWAAANNIVVGYGDNTFGPDDEVTREQMVRILYNYARFKGYDASKLADLSGYTDLGSVSDWALTAMRWANSAGLITGRTTTTLVPDGTALRAEAAVVFAKFCKRVAGME